jgi:glutamyl/glutaminyl-tRNA synthetase
MKKHKQVTTWTGLWMCQAMVQLGVLCCLKLDTASGFAYAPNFITKTVDSYLVDHKAEKGITEDEAGSPQITTRFPPEPNGYLHLGHAKAVCFSHAVARMNNGRFHLRMDDTNPTKEEKEYIDSIKEDVEWILDDKTQSPPWDGDVRKTSDYFGAIYKCALSLVESGDAYVESLSAEEMREYRGSLTKPGKDSPFKSRSIEENLVMFQKVSFDTRMFLCEISR